MADVLPKVVFLYDHHGNRIMVQDGEAVGVELPAQTAGNAALQYGVPVAGLDRDDDVTYRHLRLTPEGYLVVHVPQMDSSEQGVVGVNLKVEAISAAESYYLLIDANNRSADGAGPHDGPYPHGAMSEILFSTISITGTKGLATSSWQVSMGVITRIDGTDADVTWTEIGSMYLRSQDNATIRSQWVTSPEFLDYGVRLGTTHALISNNMTTTTSLNSGSTLPNIVGTAITPEVGDPVLRVEKISGGGDFDLEYNVWYRTHEEAP